MNLTLLPQAQRIEVRSGFFALPTDVSIGISDASFLPAAREIQTHIRKRHAQSFQAKRHDIAIPIRILHSPVQETVGLSFAPEFSAEEYRLTIDASGIRLEAGSPTGAFQLAQTLRQILLQTSCIPYLEIHDWPDLRERGLYYDLCRGRVPKLERLLELVEELSCYPLSGLSEYLSHLPCLARSQALHSPKRSACWRFRYPGSRAKNSSTSRSFEAWSAHSKIFTHMLLKNF